MPSAFHTTHFQIALLAVLLIVAGACSRQPAQPPMGDQADMEETMRHLPNTAATAPATPAIDVGAPAVFETATFGLG